MATMFAIGALKATYSSHRHGPTITHPVSNTLAISLVPVVSFGHVLVLVVYLVGVLIAGFYFSNLDTDPNRWCFIAASHVPWVNLLATKNNLVGLLLGMSYETVRPANLLVIVPVGLFHRCVAEPIHRLVGYTVWGTAHVHALSHIWKFVYTGTL